MSLSDWARNGWLVPHRTTPQELTDLLAIVDRDLADSEASATAALAASGHARAGTSITTASSSPSSSPRSLLRTHGYQSAFTRRV